VEAANDLLTSRKTLVLGAEAAVEFRVLGSLEVVEAGRPLRLGGPKPRTLLAIFLTRPGRVIASEELVEELWEGHPPASAPTALRVHMTGLRAVLEPGRRRTSPSLRLPSTPPGYRLSIEPDELDAQRFERLVVMARDEVAKDRLAEGADLFEQALVLWRGPAFADTRDLACVQVEVARLEELRASAVEDLMEARLGLGEHAALVGPLEAAVAEHPLRERLTAQLMVALYRSGRQAEALRAFTQLRLTLGEELGIEPQGQIRDLEEAILLQKPELEWVAPPLVVARRPSPTRSRARIAFVGRKRELHDLEETFSEVEAGARRTVFVGGAPGIGKTSLAHALSEQARGAGAVVLGGRCDAEPIGPYQPFAEAIRAYVRDAPNETFDDWPDPLAGELVRLVPELAGRLAAQPVESDASAETERYRLFEAVAALFGRATRPVLLVFDDLHWADGSTLLLIRHLARHPDTARLMLLCTFRDSDVGPTHALTETLNRLGAEGLADRVQLSGLEPDDVEALLRAHAPAEALAELLPYIDALQELTGGNPFFVKEVIHHLADSSAKITGLDYLASLAPKGAQDLVAQRLARLSLSASTALRVASVIGQQFTLDLLARACDLEEEAMLEAVEEALGNRLVEESAELVDRFEFAHAIVRNAVYGALSASRRVRLHRQVGEALEALLGDQPAGRLMELAHHFYEAAPTGVAPKAARYAIAAGDAAFSSVAYEDAVDHYRSALTLTQSAELDEETVGRTLLMMGRAMEGAGSREARSTYLQAAEVGRRLQLGSLLTDVCIAFAGPWLPNRGDFNRTLFSLLEDALGCVGDDLRARAQLLELKAGTLHYTGPLAEEGALAEEALTLGRQLEDPLALTAGLGAWHRFLTHGPDHAAERLAQARELVVISDEAGSDDRRLASRRRLVGDLLEVGDVVEFDCQLEEYGQLAYRRRHPGHLWSAGVFRATQASLRGELDSAEQLNAAALELGQRVEQQDAFGAFLLQTFVVRYQQGRLGEMTTHVESPTQQGVEAPVWYALLATMLAETDRRSEALRLIERLGRREFRSIPRDMFWLSAIALLAGAAATCGASDHTPTLRRLLEPYADAVVVFGVGGAFLGSVGYWLGALDAGERRWEDAQRHFTAALEAHQTMGAGFWVAQTQLDLAAVLITRAGDAASATDRLMAEALAYAERAGSRRLLTRHESVAQICRG
jgi:DNA-binding SARP family transcriptional activator